MPAKILTSVSWLLIAAAWVTFAAVVTHFSSWSDGAAAGMHPSSRLAASRLFFWVPTVVPVFAACAPYHWFPRNVLRFARWPYSVVYFFAGVLAGFLLPAVVLRL